MHGLDTGRDAVETRLVPGGHELSVLVAESQQPLAQGFALMAAEAERAEVRPVRRPTTRATRMPNLRQPPADIAAAIRAFDWDWGWATRTAFCESSLNPLDIGLAGERGLMQIHPIHLDRIQRLGYTWAQMYEVGPNLAVAYDLWREQGEIPWKGSSECRG